MEGSGPFGAGSAKPQGGRGRDRTTGPTIALVGLGPAGIGIGQALQRLRTDYTIIAHDRQAARVKAALRAGAADRGEWNLINAVEPADLIVLAESVEQQIETLSIIAEHVRPASLVVGVARRLAPLIAAADAALPANVSFIASDLVPAHGWLGEEGVGAVWCLAPGRNASDDAVRVMSRLVAAAGAQALFIDAAEHDALATGASGLPRIAYAALARVIARSPSAQDLHRLVDPSLRELLGDVDPETADDVAADPGLVAWLDQFVRELGRIREALAAGDRDALRRFFDEADAARAAWADPGAVERGARGAPDLRDIGGARQFLFGRRRDRDRGRGRG